MKSSRRWQDWLILAGGIWLFISPWFFSNAPANYTWDAFLIGILLIVFSIWALDDKKVWEEWITLVIGAWVFVSPWIFSFEGIGLEWNFFIIGGLVFILSLCDIGSGIKLHHGHKPLSAF
ncbi:MAG: SPW repeat protein [Chitinophagaceae bacterium]|nr:SPW repeat protein [Chitinophagaceae bacterium]